jgi:sigma-B regulation protein RsbU (phosphoserine phosphatase)
VVLIDVSGHGVPAALAVNRLHGELRRFFAERPSGTPGELVRSLNKFAYEELSRAGVFATCLCVRVDHERRELLYANAGHPPAFLRRGGGEVVELASTATMLGVLAPELFDNEARALAIEPGERVVAYTDGLSEATSARGEQFGIERVRGLVAAGGDEQGDLTRAVAKQAEAFRSGRSRDDLLVVDVSVRG